MTLAQGLVMLQQMRVQAAASHDAAGAGEAASQAPHVASQGFESVLATRWKHQLLTTWLLASPRVRAGCGVGIGRETSQDKSKERELHSKEETYTR